MSGIFGNDAGNTSTVTTEKSDPWAGLQPYLTGGSGPKGLFPEAAKWYESSGPNFYPGQTVAPVSPETNLAWNAATARGLAGSPLNARAGQYANQVLDGGYSNQFLNSANGDALFDNIKSRVNPAIDAKFASSGRYGSGLFADTTARALTESYAPFAMQAYEAERGRQQDAMKFMPQLAAADFQDIAALSGVGAERQQQAQNLINADISRYDFGQNRQLQKLMQYGGLLQAAQLGGTGSSQTSAQAANPNTGLSNLLGLGLAGAGIYGALK